MTVSFAHPLEGYARGQLICSGCAGLIEFGGLKPLTVMSCPNCGGSNFVPQKIGNFWLYYPLAVGGMGAVYKAYRGGEPDTFYAVKILPREERNNATLVKNLQAEIEVMNLLGEHPAMVCSPANGFEDGEFYLATKFIAGEGLDERILRLGRVGEVEVLMAAMSLLSAESHIYEKGFLYRDLKPENILISAEDGAHLCDFGICMHVEEANRTDGGDIIQGSPLYIPPERLLGEGESAYSEIYSLGLVLYHALAGHPYYEAEEVETVAKLHVGWHDVAVHNEKMQELNQDVARVISKMIRREPRDRYQTFLEVERDVFKILSSRLYG
jgi:eukaryotic-like serine/threonine-protein kinase